MALEDRKQWFEQRRALPSAYDAGVAVPVRGSHRGEPYMQSLQGSKLHALADEGSYFVATNPTVGTAIVNHAAPGANGTATKPLLLIRNNNVASTGKRVYLDYIRLSTVAVGTNGADFRYAAYVDTGNSRYASGGSEITPVNACLQYTDSPGVSLYFGAVTAAAATSSLRLVSHSPLRSVIKVAGDVYLFRFGNSSPRLTALGTAGTAIAQVERDCPPVVLGPTDQFLLHTGATNQDTADSFEFEMGFWVR